MLNPQLDMKGCWPEDSRNLGDKKNVSLEFFITFEKKRPTCTLDNYVKL